MRTIEIAVIRALHLGDLLCTIPAIRALRLAGPQSRIVLIGLPWARDLVVRYPHYFDDFMAFPGWPGIPEREMNDDAPKRLAEFHRAITSPFDVVLQLHGDGRFINDFASTVPGRVHAGFVPAGSAVPPLHVAYPEALPEPLRMLAALTPLGIDTLDPTLELPVFEADRVEARALLAAAGTGVQPYVIVHPGGRGDDRRWPFSRFAAVADALTARGLRVVVTGSAAERPIVDALVARTVSPLVDVVGRTSLGAELAGFYYCPHHPEGSVTEFAVECSCRKPAEGMILRAAAELGINPAESWMVGDTLDDVEAGNRAGCRTILLDNGNETEWRVDGKRWPSVVVGDLDRAAAIIAGVEEPSKVQYTP